VVSHIGTATPHPGILSEWIYYFLLTVDFARLAHGANMPSLPLSRINSLQIPLVSTTHQHRVVDKVEELFSEVDDGVANLETALEQLKVYRQAMLRHALAGEFTSLWRKSNDGALELPDVPTIEVSEATTAKLPTLPDGWKYVALGELIDEPRYGTSKKCAYDVEGVGVLRIPNIVSGAIDDSDLKFAQFDNAEAKAYRLRAGDILVIRSNGSVSIVGKCAVVSQREEKYLYAGYLIRIRPNPSLVRPAFLHAVLSSHALRVQIEAKAKSTSGVNNINAQELKSLIVPICSLAEQDKVLGILSRNLSVADEMSRQIEHQRAWAKALRQAILKKAFSGQLVAQEPNDEPASVLLETIKAEKQSNNKKTKKREAA
jgi:type I restriction enzyme S subunit